MPFDFAQVLVFMLVATGFVFVAVQLARWVSPQMPYPEKQETYECGERPIGPAWFSFNPRFYLIALVFVIFDVEVALTFPVAAVFRSWVASGQGLVAFAELAFFVAILGSGLAYVWRKGDLEWVNLSDPAAESPHLPSSATGSRGGGARRGPTFDGAITRDSGGS